MIRPAFHELRFWLLATALLLVVAGLVLPRVKLTRAGARWLLIAVGSVVLLACAVAALWPWDGERMGWWDYAWRSFLNYEDVSLDGQHTLLRFFGLLALVAAICLSSWPPGSWLTRPWSPASAR